MSTGSTSMNIFNSNQFESPVGLTRVHISFPQLALTSRLLLSPPGPGPGLQHRPQRVSALRLEHPGRPEPAADAGAAQADGRAAARMGAGPHPAQEAGH